jgi:hypothetical protein
VDDTGDDTRRRRSADRDRRRWNDQSLDKLDGSVENVERGLGTVHRRIDKLFEALVDEKPDGTVSPATSALDWKTILAVAATIVVPIVVAIIMAPG